MKNLKVNLPPYFVLDDVSKNETQYNLSYHFHGHNEKTINIWFNKTVNETKRDEVSLGIFDDKVKNEFEKSKTIINNKNISEKELIKLINKIRF